MDFLNLFLRKKEYHLENACEMNRINPRSFIVPSTDEIADLRVGDLVRLIFVFNKERSDGCRAERMWVVIRSAEDGVFTGVLDNEPRFLKTVRCGDSIHFSAEHIATIYCKGKSIGFDTSLIAIITERAIENRQINWVLRTNNLNNQQDSGWQLYYGDESSDYLDDPKNSTLITLDRAMDIEPLLESVFAGSHHAYEYSDADNRFVEVDYDPDDKYSDPGGFD